MPAIRARRPEVPEPLAAVLARMLAKDRSDRFRTPADVVAALEPMAAGTDLLVLLSAQTGTGETA